jgi:histidinol dehydrogenase
MTIRVLKSDPPFTEIRTLLRASAGTDPTLRDEVARIVQEVATRGDDALLEFVHRFDGFQADSVDSLRIPPHRLTRAIEELDPLLLASLRSAADNIRGFHERQLERGFLDVSSDGTILGQRVAPLRRVGIYVPGGRAAYPSSVLMNAIPASVAGVPEIVMATPARDGHVEESVLAAASISGVTEVIRVGGAHAVSALAYGTRGIQAVDKITGPGSRWVAEAKRQVFGLVDIDMIAGPSEILVIADESADPRHIAADLIGQAEHDPDAIAWLVTPVSGFAESVPREIERLLSRNPRRETAAAALASFGLVCLVPDLESAAEVANLRAPEHLELLLRDALAFSGKIRNAGAIFLGSRSPEPVGDYFAGPNHVLPTGGTARWASPLGVYDFLKRTSLIGYSEQRLRRDAEHVIRLAESEGFTGHAEAIRVRLQSG